MYLDDIIICGKDQTDHDHNLRKFLDVAKMLNLTLNSEKCTFSQSEIRYLGYLISNGSLQPDPQRLTPLMEMPIPQDTPSLRRMLGLFSYYSRWVDHYSEKIQPLRENEGFPLSEAQKDSINSLREAIKVASLVPFDETLPITVETDASDHTLSAVLLQGERPIAFFSRTVKSADRCKPSIEKEASAIIESITHWRHFLLQRHFTLVTDQQAVAFVFDKKGRGRSKNDKILRWRIELSTYSYDVKYRPGSQNLAADALSRCNSVTVNKISLSDIHTFLCHPGVTRLLHYAKSRNLPYSTEDVRRVCESCSICRELKPQFYKPPKSHIIKSNKPFEDFG